MAHMVETMAYAGEVPWHGLGVEVNPNLSPKEMMKEANVDWTVEKRPLYYNGLDKKEVIPGKEALIRTSDGQLLDVVGTNWKPLQNEDAFNFFGESNGSSFMTSSSEISSTTSLSSVSSFKLSMDDCSSILYRLFFFDFLCSFRLALRSATDNFLFFSFEPFASFFFERPKNGIVKSSKHASPSYLCTGSPKAR